MFDRVLKFEVWLPEYLTRSPSLPRDTRFLLELSLFTCVGRLEKYPIESPENPLSLKPQFRCPIQGNNTGMFALFSVKWGI